MCHRPHLPPESCAAARPRSFPSAALTGLRALLLPVLLIGCALRSPPDDVARGTARSVALGPARAMIGRLLWPVRGGTVSSPFGWRLRSFHEGVDIRAKEGTPVHGAHDGVVVYSSSAFSGYGNMVVIRGRGLLSAYGHNRVNLVRRGDMVRRGDVIAEVGHTGRARGSHLHFEVRVKDRSGKNVAVDPRIFFPRAKADFSH